MKHKNLHQLIKKTVIERLNRKSMLNEVDYEDIFSRKTLDTLKYKSFDAFVDLGLDYRQRNQAISQLLPQLQRIEKPHEDLLVEIAKEIVTTAHPIIKTLNIKIEAYLGPGQLPKELKNTPKEPPIATPKIGKEVGEVPWKKRRVINSITHGAALRGTFAFLMYKEYLDFITVDEPELLTKYEELMKSVFGSFDDEDSIAAMLEMVQRKAESKAGESEITASDDDSEEGGEQRWTIRATGICFAVLIHEIEKGLFEILSNWGFTSNDEDVNTAIIDKADKLEHEPRDMQYGKFIYDAISKLYQDSRYSDDRIRDYLFTEIYSIDDETEFLELIENIVNEELTPAQKKWVDQTMQKIESDLKQMDAGIEFDADDEDLEDEEW